MLGCGSDGPAIVDAPPTYSQGVVTTTLADDPFGSSYCLPASVDTLDVDPNNPGLQPDCTVTDTQNLGSADEAQQLIPSCTMSGSDATTVSPTSPTPCWWTDENATSCPDAPSLEINFVAGPSPIPAGTVTVINCAVVPP
jgi:hypothetical protein